MLFHSSLFLFVAFDFTRHPFLTNFASFFFFISVESNCSVQAESLSAVDFYLGFYGAMTTNTH